MIQSAVVREIEIIGEAARAISDETRQQHPEIPWAQIIGMRNRIVHRYFDVRWDVVWDVIQKDIPALIPLLVVIVPPEDDDAASPPSLKQESDTTD